MQDCDTTWPTFTVAVAGFLLTNSEKLLNIWRQLHIHIGVADANEHRSP